MSEIEKIQGYIKESNAPHNKRYDVSIKEVFAMEQEMGAVEAVALAFDYGRAKGYRAAKAEVRAWTVRS